MGIGRYIYIDWYNVLHGIRRAHRLWNTRFFIWNFYNMVYLQTNSIP